MTGRKIADNWRTRSVPARRRQSRRALAVALGRRSSRTTTSARRSCRSGASTGTRSAPVQRRGTFNVFNFSKKQLEVVPHGADDRGSSWSRGLAADVVPAGEDQRRHLLRRRLHHRREPRGSGAAASADEIWAIWTVSTRDEWRDGFVAQYFHIIETAADTNFFTFWNRIEKNNDEIAAGQPGEFGRTSSCI